MRNNLLRYIISTLLVFSALGASAEKIVINKINGRAEKMIGGQGSWMPAKVKDILNSGDQIKTGSQSNAELITLKGHIILLQENATLAVTRIDEKNFIVKLNKGALTATSKKLKRSERFEVRTPNATCSVRGTRFSVRYENGQTNIDVFKGSVEAYQRETGKSVIIKKGQQSSIVGKNNPTPPKKIEKPKKKAPEKAKKKKKKEPKKKEPSPPPQKEPVTPDEEPAIEQEPAEPEFPEASPFQP